MNNDSVFLHNLLGKRVRIVAVDEEDLPPLTLREVSNFGVVAEDSVERISIPGPKLWRSVRPGTAASTGRRWRKVGQSFGPMLV